MSTRPARNSRRRALIEKLWHLGRAMSTGTVFLHQAIAETVGLNATDTKCIDLILRAPGACLSAGELADLSGLSSGAVTHILDRLERQKFVRRERDASDRRKVFVHVRGEALAQLVPKYEAIGQAFMTLLDQYGEEELRLIADYLEKTTEVSRRELEKLAAARRRPSARYPKAVPGTGDQD